MPKPNYLFLTAAVTGDMVIVAVDYLVNIVTPESFKASPASSYYDQDTLDPILAKTKAVVNTTHSMHCVRETPKAIGSMLVPAHPSTY